ncbi:YqaJ viral recombinase family protein [Lactobacillus sp. CC-MHH1034]|uniref:YqaJ viral recombinase family nuclease n=1 Tax=Agrilactobacillus fermenti TaxID=2586909 RepID=UPI001E2A2BAF|nr:YqaJ viral recombinase family protein [Agrilactobacillus fermenti]MCD2257399.1 YqaJ viral recombinase family protein [Agrilactobacillus fermenti]
MQIIKTADMNIGQWLANRRNGIGGSDVSAILGLNKYRSPFEVWLDKTGQIPIDTRETSDAIHFGNVFEEIVAQEFAHRTDKKVFRQNKTFIHPEYPMLRANIDRDIAHEPGFLECKTANAFLAKNWEGDEIPEAYLLQVQHYMNVLNRPYCYIAALIGGQKFVYKRIERDQELINLITDKLVDWWRTYIEGNKRPPIDGSPAATNFLNTYLADKSDGDVIELKSEDFELLEQRQKLKQTQAIIKKELDSIDNNLKLEMEHSDVGLLSGYKVFYKAQERAGVDTKLLKKDYPDIYEKVTKTTHYRSLRIKEDVKNGNE